MGVRRMQTIVDSPDAELICVSDVKLADAEAAAARFDVPYHRDHQDVGGRSDVDAVIVCVPNRFHLEVTKHLMASGKQVWCEKPLAGTPDDAWQMVETAIESRVNLKTGSNLRHFPTVTKAKDLLDAGAIGRPLFARGWIGHEGWQTQGTWYSDPDMIGGGTMLDNGCHLFDLTRWFLGEVVACTGVVDTRMWDVAPLEDNAMAILSTQTGVPVFLHASWTEWRGYSYFEIYGSEGSVEIDNRNPASRTVFRPRSGGQEEVYDYSSEPPTSYVDELHDYLSCMEAGRSAAPTGYDGLRAVQLAWAVYESARTGARVATFGSEEEALYQRYLASEPATVRVR